MDRDEIKAAFGRHLHRCIDGVDHPKGNPVGTVDREGLLAITDA